MPKLQKQERNSNNCALIAAAFMLGICLDKFITDAVYVSSSDQRSWLSELLSCGVLAPCPRVVEKPPRFLETNPPQDLPYFLQGTQ